MFTFKSKYILLQVRTRNPVINHPILLHNLYFSSISELVKSKQSPPLTPSLIKDFLVNSCGLSPNRAASVSKKFKSNFHINKPKSVVNFLENNGFSRPQISKIVSIYPRVLFASIDRNLKPKIRYFKETLSISESQAADLLASKPKLFLSCLETIIIPSLEYVRGIVKTNENVIRVAKRSQFLLLSNPYARIEPNLSLLRDHNVPDSRILHLFLSQPSIFSLKREKLKETLEAAGKLGFKPEMKVFTTAIHAMSSMHSSTWDLKIRLLKDLGWSEDQIFEAFKRQPLLLACSEKKMKLCMSFFVKTLNWDASVMTKYPNLFLFSLESRVMPRLAVCKILMEKGIVGEDLKLTRVLYMSEETFMKNYVAKYGDVLPDLLKRYRTKRKWDDSTTFE